MGRLDSGLRVATSGNPSVCMVVGCGKKAIYRNVMTVRMSRCKGNRYTAAHGYCSDHKSLAVCAANRSLESEADYYSRFDATNAH